MDFSLWWLLLLWSTGSRRTGFNSCGMRAQYLRLTGSRAQAQLLCSMWDLPGPGLEPVSPALADRFLTTAPPGKPLIFSLELELDQLPIKCFHIHPKREKRKGLGVFVCLFYWILMPAESQMARKSRLLWFPILTFKSE